MNFKYIIEKEKQARTYYSTLYIWSLNKCFTVIIVYVYVHINRKILLKYYMYEAETPGLHD